MGLLDNVKQQATDAAGSAIDVQNFDTKATDFVNGAADKAKAALSSLPGGDMAAGLVDKAKGLLDSDGDGEIDVMAKVKGLFGKD